MFKNTFFAIVFILFCFILDLYLYYQQYPNYLSVIESISNQLQEYFNKNDVIHSKQSGFRQNHPCYTALTRLINSWLKKVDSGKYGRYGIP